MAASMNPTVDPTLADPIEGEFVAPPPGYVPSSPPTVPPITVAGTPHLPGRGWTLRPEVLDWFPAGCFTLIFLLTLLPWAGLYPGGHEAYSQGPWRASVGRFSTDSFSESVMRLQTPLTEYLRSNWMLVIYLLGLIVALAISWADRALARQGSLLPPTQVGFVNAVWPHRLPVLAGLAIGLLVLISLQTYSGYGLEAATERMVAADFSKQAADAATPASPATTAADLHTLEIRQGMAVGQYGLRTTFWLALAIGTHVVAVLALALRLWLFRRGSKPLPRVVVEA